MRAILLFAISLLSLFGYSQNKETLYDFTDLPQSLLLNPGADVRFNYHLGVPFLSQIHVNAGLKGASLYDVFADDGRDINDKIETTLNTLTSKDYLTATQQLEIVSFGWKSKKNEKIYFSGGIYQELDVIGYFPKDFAVLAYQGNQDFLNQSFRFSTISGSAELLAVYHFGYTKKVNKSMTFGARAKLYSSIFHARSAKNKGTFTTLETPQGSNIYQHVISNADVTLRTSGYRGLKDLEGKEIANKLIGRALLGGNLGLGIDLGFTHKINEQLAITGSVNDLGVIVYNKDVETYRARGNYVFEGFETPIQFSGQNPENFLDELEEAIPLDTLSTTYVTMRPLKFNGSVKYSFNKYDDGTCNCYLEGEQPPYLDAFGIQLFSQFRPKRPQYAASLFYYKRFFSFLRTKLTYTIDDYSYNNIGFLLSTHIDKINFYISANNLLEYTNLAKARGASLQLGFNIIM
ncbi:MULTISPECIES: DUF5723 family protein [Aquimarina]|uniref:DUF5723 domain-containing protein n=1 Tax=Aquimarina algiphila TaxID=2047982 RepID=A0A554VR42_9FLAO|nr:MULTISPECIES: DUF5723 family protein [Aquimarina]TSE11080.1 hypothetical protein FOF46_02305 [Aquimarina algiphila]